MRRRGLSGPDVVLGAMFLVFVAVTIGPALLGREVLLDSNLLTQWQPFTAVQGKDIATTNTCRSDTVDQIMPFISQIRRTLFSGAYPTWNPYVVGGSSTAWPNWGQFSPLSLPYYVLPLWLAPAFVKLAEFATVLVGMVAFLRRLGLRIASGVLAAVVYAASGFMISWTNWPQTRVAALVPAVFWAVEVVVQGRRVRSLVPLALTLLFMLLGGFPAVTGMTLYAAAAYFVVRVLALHHASWRRMARAVALVVGGLLLAGLLSAFQMLPFAAQLSQSDFGYRDALKGVISPLATLLTVVSPDVYGSCLGGETKLASSPVEVVAFVGAAAVVLALVAVAWPAARSRRRSAAAVGFLVVAIVVVVVLGWFGGPLLAAVQHLPVFSNNLIIRIRVLLGFFLAALAGFGLDRLLAGRRRPPRDDHEDGPGHGPGSESGDALGGGATAHPTRTRTRAQQRALARADARAARAERSPWGAVTRVVVVVAAGVLAVDTLLKARTLSIAEGFYSELRHHVEVAAGLVVLTVVLVLIVRLAPRPVGRAATLAVAALVVGQSISFAAPVLGGSDRSVFYPVTPTHAFLQANLGEDRFSATDLVGFPPTASYYSLRTPTGHQFTNAAWADLLRAVDPSVFKTPTFSDFGSKALPLASVGRSPILDRLAVTYWLAGDGSVPGTLVEPSPSGPDVQLAVGATSTCSVPPSGLRAVVLRTTAPITGTSGRGAVLDVRIASPDGVVTGSRYLGPAATRAGDLVIPVPGEHLTGSTPLTVTISASGLAAPAELSGDGSGGVACGTVTPVDDGLELVDSSSGTTTYHRLTAQPRIRWAGASTVVTGAAAQVGRLAAGVPSGTVVLGAPAASTAGGTTTGSGSTSPSTATLDVRHDQGAEVEVTSRSDGPGYLVVADALQQPGWSATVDGRPSPLVAADHAFGAVAVPAGTHDVRLSYLAPGLRVGTLLSLVGLVVLLAILLLDGVVARRAHGSHHR